LEKTNKINFKYKKVHIKELLWLKYELSKHNGLICGKMATHQNKIFCVKISDKIMMDV